MDNNSKLYNIILFSLLGISAVLSVLFFFTDDVIGAGTMLNWCYVLLGIAVVAAIGFSIVTMAKDISKAKASLVGMGALIVIMGIGYLLSTDEAYQVGEEVVEGAVSKRAEAGLIGFYIMFLIAVGSIIFVELRKALK